MEFLCHSMGKYKFWFVRSFVRLFVPFHYTNATLPEVISPIAFLCGRMIDHVFPPFDLAIFVGLRVMRI